MEKFEKMTINERKGYLLKKIDEIKSVFSGRETSLVEFTHIGYAYSDEKCDEFINEMMSAYSSYWKERDKIIDDKFIEFTRAFIKVSVMVCLIQCRKSDYVFESIIKFAKVAYKPQNGGKSIFDVLVGDVNEKNTNEIDFSKEKKILNDNYKIFNELYNDCYNDDFEGEMRIAVNKFLESKKCDLFTDINRFEQAVRVLNSDIRRLTYIKKDTEVLNDE